MEKNVIVTLNGMPIITNDIVAAAKENIIKNVSYSPEALAYVNSEDFIRNLIDGLITQAIVDEYIKKQGIDKTPEYQAEFADNIKRMQALLNSKFFSQQFKFDVSDAEVLEFYEENEDHTPNKENAKEAFERHKRGELSEAKINELKEAYNVVIDEEYFNN